MCRFCDMARVRKCHFCAPVVDRLRHFHVTKVRHITECHGADGKTLLRLAQKLHPRRFGRGHASGNVVVALPGVYDEETMAATDTADEIAFRNHSLSRSR